MKLLLAVSAAALLMPATAAAVTPTLVVRDVPLHAQRTTAGVTPRFNMVGLHWRGAGTVEYRTRGSHGWSGWRLADADTAEHGWRLGNLDWTGAATAIRFRTSGTIRQLRAYYVNSPVAPVATRRLQIANAPPIISRFGWQADESIKRAAPQYSDAVHFAVVHHTAGTNNYSRQQSAAIVRGIEVYHVKGNGWNDIGYNFLVDRYGQIFEGRYGGVDKPVIGAHAEGFNTGSVGISVLGSYGNAKPSAAAVTALEQVLAWKLDLAHVDPNSTLTWRSGGNPRFASGIPVFLRAISGHRDTGFTDCPGNALYAMLPQIAKATAALGGPKIYAPLAARNGEGQVRFTAKLSVAQPWTVTITNSSGAQVAQGTGTGTAVDWTWDGSAAPPDRYAWTIGSADARSASGSLGAVAALAVQKASVSQSSVAPGETATFAYTLTAPATVTATLVSPANEVLATLLTAAKPAGAQTLAFTPPPGLANGQYTVAVSAVSGAKTATATIPFAVDDILTGLANDGPSLSFTLTRAPLSLAFQVLRDGDVVATPAAPALAPGPQALTWDGTLADGARAPDGSYTLALTVTDELVTFTRTLPLVLDSTAPRVSVLSYKNMRFRVGEASTLVLKVGAKSYRRILRRPLTTQFWLKHKPKRYTLTATDAAGNVSTVRYRA